jgi:hypothetical protein
MLCEICGLNYCPEEPADRRLHTQHCRRAIKARDFYGPWLPLGYRAREEMKGDWEGRSPVDYLERVIQSHFARSLEAMNYDTARHPSFERYASAWLAGDRGFYTDACYAPALKELRKRWPPRRSPHLPSGTYWE